MKKFWIQFVTLIIIILAGTYLTFNPSFYGNFFSNSSSGTGIVTTKQLKVGETIVTVELADTPAKRQHGLSDRASLDPNSGMLFLFSERKKYQFWMKDMLIPLDFIFIREGKVVDVIKNVPPPPSGTQDANLPRYEPTSEIDMLLEVNAGFTDSHNIKVNDSVSLVE